MTRIAITNGKAHVGVIRGNNEQRWWVLCGICKPGFSSLFGMRDGGSGGGMLSVSNVIAHAPTWLGATGRRYCTERATAPTSSPA